MRQQVTSIQKPNRCVSHRLPTSSFARAAEEHGNWELVSITGVQGSEDARKPSHPCERGAGLP